MIYKSVRATSAFLGAALWLFGASSAQAQFGFGGPSDPGQDTRQALKRTGIPLLRFLRIPYQQHFYTGNEADKYNLNGPLQEKSVGYILSADIAGTVPLYRLKKPGEGFFCTISDASKQSAMKTGFDFDGTVGYVSPVKTPDTTPLFRLYRAAKPRTPNTTPDASNYPDHFYTSDAAEKDAAVKSQQYVDEGIEGYVWTKPVVYSGSGVPADGSYHPLPYIQASIALNNRYESYFGVPNTDSSRTDALIAKLRLGPSAREEQYQAGLKPDQADDFFAALLQNDSLERQLVIDTAYQQVEGQYASEFDNSQDNKKWQAQLKAGKGSYGVIYLSELAKLSNNPDARRAMIDRAYLTTMGRQPTDHSIDHTATGQEKGGAQGEESYWMPRKEHFSQIVSASRDWLYSPAGNADLMASIDRALRFRMFLKHAPSETQRQAELAAWQAKRAIFAEKIAPQNFGYYVSQLNQQAEDDAKDAALTQSRRPKPTARR